MAKVALSTDAINVRLDRGIAALGVRIADDSRAPERVVFEGPRYALEALIGCFWPGSDAEIAELRGQIEDGGPPSADAPTALNEFVDELADTVVRFKAAYLAKHAQNPDHYPLEIGANNAGAWYENFMFFYTDGSV